MNRTTKVLLITFALSFIAMHSALAQDDLAEPLKPFKPYLGKTWKGTFANSTPEKPVIDISHWERALNGQAIRTLHSINNGEYGGESIIFWDKEKQSLVYYYFTTAGFFTTGTMKFENNKMIAHEYVKGEAGGTTEVQSTAEIMPDGKLITKAQYLKNGKWERGHEATYVEDASAEVIFK